MLFFSFEKEMSNTYQVFNSILVDGFDKGNVHMNTNLKVKQLLNAVLPIGLGFKILSHNDILHITMINKQSYYSRARLYVIAKDECANPARPWQSPMWKQWLVETDKNRAMLWRDKQKLSGEIRAFIWYTNPNKLENFITQTNNNIVSGENDSVVEEWINALGIQVSDSNREYHRLKLMRDFYNGEAVMSHERYYRYRTHLANLELPTTKKDGSFIWPHLHSAEARLKWLNHVNSTDKWTQPYSQAALIAIEQVEQVDNVLGQIWSHLTVRQKRIWLYPTYRGHDDFVKFWNRLSDETINQIPAPPPYSDSQPTTVKWPVAATIRQYLKGQPSKKPYLKNMLEEVVDGLNTEVRLYWLDDISKYPLY